MIITDTTILDCDDDRADACGVAGRCFLANLPVKPRILPHAVTPIPARLLPLLVGEAPWMDAPDEFSRLVGPRTQGLTALICEAVTEAPCGYTAAEMTRALQDAGFNPVRLADQVKAALAGQARDGHLNRHLEVVQERGRGHTDDILRTVTVYEKAKAPGGFEAYGGFRDADCPKAFRGEICIPLLYPPTLNDFVRHTKGPITKTPVFLAMQERVLAWLYGDGAASEMAKRCQQASRGNRSRSVIFR